MKKLTVSLTLLCLLAAGTAFAAPQDAGAPDAKAYKGKAEKKGSGPFEMCDANKDGTLSREEFLARHPHGGDIFDAMDADKDGKLTKKEMRVFFEACKAAKKTPRKFERIDTNNDGALSRDEFLAAFPKGGERFDAADANKDGTLTKEEWQAYAEARREERRRAEFKRCDLNADGMLSLDEFVQCKPAPRREKGKGSEGRPAPAN